MQLSEGARLYLLRQWAREAQIVHAICPKCPHPVAEHQPAWGRRGSEGGGHTLYGCSVCNCELTENEKLRAWGGR